MKEQKKNKKKKLRFNPKFLIPIDFIETIPHVLVSYNNKHFYMQEL